MQASIGNLMITSFCSENMKHKKFRFDLKLLKEFLKI